MTTVQQNDLFVVSIFSAKTLLLILGHLSVRTRCDVELLLGVAAAALDEVQLQPVDGDRVARVVRTSQGLLPAAERHLEILE